MHSFGVVEPVTLITIFILFVLGGGGASAAVASRRRRARRLELKDSIRDRVVVDGNLEVSVFDVFWDLGVNEYALEIMANQGLLPKDPDDLRAVLDQIADEVQVHGSYSTFVRETIETIETIEEFYRGHRTAGNRRALPALEVREAKTLELPAVGAKSNPSETANLPVPYTGGFRPVAARTFDERVEARSGGNLSPLATSSTTTEVDVDQLANIDPLRMLKSVFDGNLGHEIERWFRMRSLRQRKTTLDELLSELYSYYAEQVAADPRFYTHLYDIARRWEMEVTRVEKLIDREAWDGKKWEICGEVLMNEALAVSRQLSWLARNNVDQSIERIHDHARRGDTAMAGYLIYLNHHAFFAGRGGRYPELVQKIENATYRLQEEIRELTRKGVV